MRLGLAALIISLLLAGSILAVGDSGIERIYPNTPSNSQTWRITPNTEQVWRVTLDTDASGDASYITGLLTGKLESIEVITNDLNTSTNLTITDYVPGKNTTIFSNDIYSDNRVTYFPRIDGNPYMISGLVRLAIEGGAPNREVLIYLSIER